LPDGSSCENLSSPLRKNIFLYCFCKSEVWCPRPASMQRAFWPIVTEREAGCDGRAGLAGRAMPMRTAKSCGPGAPTLALSWREMISPTMGARKPGPQGEHDISVKTIAQGMPDDLAEPVVTAACFFYCRRAMGEAFTRHSLRPLIFRGHISHQLGRDRAARMIGSVLGKCSSHSPAVMPPLPASAKASARP
jgi:hypothetical protein